MKMLKNRWWMPLALLTAAACNESEGPCPDGSEATTVDGAIACVYQDAQAIIENGFRCPSDRPLQLEMRTAEGERRIICSAEPVDGRAVLEARGEAPAEAAAPPADPMPAEPDPREPDPREPDPMPDDPMPDDPDPMPDPRPDPRPDRGDPEPDPAPDPIAYRQLGEQCSIVVELECDRNPCWACDAGLECVPHADEDAPFGRCVDAREPADAGAECEPDDHLSCGKGQGCARDDVCRNLCRYNSIDCGFGDRCPGRGSICEPSPSIVPQACQPGAGDCPAGEGCRLSADDSFVQNANWRLRGFECAPLADTPDGEACRFSEDCREGSVCSILTGYNNDNGALTAIYGPTLDAPLQHPLSGRSPSVCLPLCSGDADCGEGLVCQRIANSQDLPTDPPVLLHFGVCAPPVR